MRTDKAGRQRQSGRGRRRRRRSRQEQQEVSRARNSIECVCALNAAIIAVPGEGVEREWGAGSWAGTARAQKDIDPRS